MTCANCGLREASGSWAGENYCGLCSARNPQQYPQWCDLCMRRAQLSYSQKMADRVPELTRQIEELERADVR